jgi:hypothetical protein
MKCLSFILFLYTLNNSTNLRSCCVCVLLCVRQAAGWWFVRTETCSIVLCDIKVLCWTVYFACLWFRKTQRNISKLKKKIFWFVFGGLSVWICAGVLSLRTEIWDAADTALLDHRLQVVAVTGLCSELCVLQTACLHLLFSYSWSQ